MPTMKALFKDDVRFCMDFALRSSADGLSSDRVLDYLERVGTWYGFYVEECEKGIEMGPDDYMECSPVWTGSPGCQGMYN